MDQILKIAIDCRDLQISLTGTRTYLDELIKGFDRSSNYSFEIYKIQPIFKVRKANSFIGKILGHLDFIIWKQILLPFLTFVNKADILICTDYVIPLLTFHVKKIVVFHDIFFWQYPEDYNKLWLSYFRFLSSQSLKKSDKIIVPSYYVKNKLMQYFNIVYSKIEVVYEAPKELHKNKTIDSVALPKRYLLHVGTFSRHKNLINLIYAYKKFTKVDKLNTCLILVGGKSDSRFDNILDLCKKSIMDLNLEKRIFILGYVSDDMLYHIYKNSNGYVFPSYNEGFGIPILEAMTFNLPIIAANNSALPEIAKDAAVYFDPYNINQIALSLQKVSELNEEILKSLKNHSFVLSKYSWDKTVCAYFKICFSLIESC